MLLEGGFRQSLEELGLWEWGKRADFASGRVIEDAEREKIPSGWRNRDAKVVRIRVAVDRVGDMEGRTKHGVKGRVGHGVKNGIKNYAEHDMKGGMEWLARNMA